MGSQVKIRLHFFFAIFDKSDTKKNRNVLLSFSTSLRSTANKPEGCCMWMMVDGKTEDISKDTDKIQVHVRSLPVICGFFLIEQIWKCGVFLSLNYAPYVEYLLSFGVQHIRTRQVREQRRLRPRLPNAASRNLTTITKEKRALGAQGV